MRYRYIELLFTHQLCEPVSDHHRPMTSARATDPDAKISFSFSLIKWEQVFQQPGKPLDRLLNVVMLPKKFHDLWMVAAEFLQFWFKKGIGQMAHVEHQIEVARTAVFMSKTYYLNPEWSSLAGTSKLIDDHSSERMHRVFRSIDH